MLPWTGLLQGSMGRGSHKQTCRQDRDMPRKRPTPRLQHQQPGLRGWQGEGDKGMGWAEPWAQSGWARRWKPGSTVERRVLGDAQAGPSRKQYWHHPGTLGSGTWGTGVQEMQLMPGNPSPPWPELGEGPLAHHKDPKSLREAVAQPGAPWEVTRNRGWHLSP